MRHSLSFLAIIFCAASLSRGQNNDFSLDTSKQSMNSLDKPVDTIKVINRIEIFGWKELSDQKDTVKNQTSKDSLEKNHFLTLKPTYKLDTYPFKPFMSDILKHQFNKPLITLNDKGGIVMLGSKEFISVQQLNLLLKN